jgi:hypothetical protein
MQSIQMRLALAAVVLAVAAFALGFIASGNADGGSKESDIISGIAFIDGAGLHEIDESITVSKDIPDDAHARTLEVQTVVKLTDWPDDLDDDAEKLADALGKFAMSIDSDNPNMAEVATLIEGAHSQYHNFSHDVWTWLQDQAGIEAHGGDAHQ